jgi:hypothetical protein
VIPVLFEHNLRKAAATGAGDAVLTVAQVLGMEPAAARLRNPATDSEVVLALRVLEGCCLLCPACAAAAHRYNAVKVRTASRSVLLHLLSALGDLASFTQSCSFINNAMQCNAMTDVRSSGLSRLPLLYYC